MPLYITRVMWSALLTNGNEASGAWIDVTHMLMGEMMGAKQANHKSLNFAQVWFNGHLLVLSSGSLGSTSDALRLMNTAASKEDEECGGLGLNPSLSFIA